MIAASAYPSGGNAQFGSKPSKANRLLGFEQPAAAGCNSAAGKPASTKNLNNLLADDGDDGDSDKAPQGEQPGLIQQLLNFFFSKLWSPATSDAEKLGWTYVYAEDGSLLAEYGEGSAATSGSAQYLWLPTANGPMPIAAVVNGQTYAVHSDHLNTPRKLTQANGQAVWQWPTANGPMPIAAVVNGQTYAVHSDHLNTPRKLTQANGQAVWQWAYSAFGDEQPTTAAKRFTSEMTVPTTGATSIPDVTFNLRYPGQYFDKETGLHYNYFRTYAPGTGRYTQGDPIGLDGGWNRFGYVGGNPLSFVDPFGLTWEDVIKAMAALSCDSARYNSNANVRFGDPGKGNFGATDFWTGHITLSSKDFEGALTDSMRLHLLRNLAHEYMHSNQSRPSRAAMNLDDLLGEPLGLHDVLGRKAYDIPDNVWNAWNNKNTCTCSK
ncbi:hypothetical protein A1D30_19600 [Acidovorax sp. GW101-3H11]|uniref:RHS repeat-associated core domain-containing protein n=1 Tax=Acidovorax sp. GW101-3H11 TaxID=1813946 RepID=UPI0007B52405|nr:RHS repeat-associated core domain-containing protein [Acidovorax sp. GW101-3H11]KZT14206.1 hypothetical protein A1D30_19600 [Acidovorax sp. GW101-3H11]